MSGRYQNQNRSRRRRLNPGRRSRAQSNADRLCKQLDAYFRKAAAGEDPGPLPRVLQVQRDFPAVGEDAKADIETCVIP